MGSTRQTTLAVDLGGEQLVLRRLSSRESLGRPFSITIEIFSPLAELDILPHLGKPASVSVSEDGVLMRHFNGIVVEGEYIGDEHEGHLYRLALRPWTHLLAHNQDYRIFQDKTAIDIIKQVLGPHGFAAIDYGKLTKTTPKRTYCVQYGESDFAFISRLMEEEGIYYHYLHVTGKHTMVLCDAPSSHGKAKHPALTYNPTSASVVNTDSAARSAVAAKFYVQRWIERVMTGAEAKVTLRDFDFEKPQTAVEVKSSATAQHGLDALEVYDWPGRYVTAGEGTPRAQTRLEARRAGRKSYTGETQLASLESGHGFKLAEHGNPRFNRGYLITAVEHMIATEQHRSGGASGGQQVRFEAIPDDVVFHSTQVTPRPVVRGPETAIVTGPSGETIYTDKYGRVKVRFHWDRGRTPGEGSTCWIRVSQTGGLGNIILPRVGHEVIVDFLDGDPDRPIVVGRVFNAENMPVYALPDNKTRALWRTKTYGTQSGYGKAVSLDTGAPKANELRFEDKGGKEEVFLHAERDMNVRVRHSETHHIGLDQATKIGGSRITEIKETEKLDVKKSIDVISGTTIEITAKTSITFIVGKTKITLDPTSVTIATTMFKLDAKATADMKSPMTTVKGDGMLTLKGGVTLIN